MSTSNTELPAYPGNDQFLFNTPLYSIFAIAETQVASLVSKNTYAVEGYCTACKTQRVFHFAKREDFALKQSLSSSLSNQSQFDDVLRYSCAKDSRHQFTAYVRIAFGRVRKLGQNPSYADVVIAQDAALTKSLSADDRREYNKAIGLAAHDTGIGAYAYLRRIFERLIWSRFNQHKTEQEWPEDEFTKMRMNEKISHLKSFLPPLMVQNAASYGIISDGIHNLSEEQCLTFFPVLRNGILLMLQQDIERIEREKNEQAFTTAITKYKGSTKP